ncbi:monooxygenase AflN [Cyphellophora attinorum]|uniref:Monooxygenase AflN n=1 Tax=Cyphellophora attinorum TaxID=1664694 RepID=A0A0N0NMP3_9EURO|nr:monooxygenase AflN [Phialophora attinorum]KPI40691.1 monooxygenase AflN [Phialophora attinorum]
MRLLVLSTLSGAVVLLLLSLFRFVIKFRSYRAFYKDVPCPPHDPIWGHLKLLGDLLAELPPNFHYQSLMEYIGRKYNMPPVYQLDLWPAAHPMILCSDPAAIAHMTQTHSFPKHPAIDSFVSPLTGKPTMVAVDGPEYKKIRSIVMPSFAPSHVASLTPVMSRHVARFIEKLEAFADTGETFKLQDHAMSLTLDVICEVVMGIDTDSQRQYNALAYHFGQAAKNTPISGLNLGVLKMFIPRWWHASRQTSIVTKIIRDRHAQSAGTKSQRTKVAIDLFIQAYNEQQSGATDQTRLDPSFSNLAVVNIKTLLMGGHDTTSATIAYMLALLSTHPAVTAKLRAEHERVFSGDPTTTFATIAAQIDAKPALLSDSSLPYTAACIKETLRVFTPGNSNRLNPADPSEGITYNGNEHIRTLPGAQLWLLLPRLHRDPAVFPRPHSFIPERHLPSSPFGPIPKDAFRPFEKGPRACVGSEIAMMEMKLVLIGLVCSGLIGDVRYPDPTPLAPEGSGLGGVDSGVDAEGNVYEERRWWSVMEFAAKPNQGLPFGVLRPQSATKK